MSFILSAHAKKSALRYKPKNRTPAFETAQFPVIRQDVNGENVKRFIKVRQNNGDREYIHHLLNETFQEFNDAANESGWGSARCSRSSVRR